MDAFTLTVSLALTAGVFGLILYPLWQQTRPEITLQTGRSGRTLEEYQARYQATLDAIKDLMFDYEMGKISAEDYDKLLAKTKLEAAGVRHQIDRLSRSVATDVEAALDVEIERLVAQLRHNNQPGENKALLSQVEAEIELLKNIRLESTQMDEAICPHCGQPFLPGDAFCSICGQPLPEVTAVESKPPVNVCSACSYAYQTGDAFCARCGLALADELKVSPREDVVI
jgi:uncharacterized OB-fold protein